MPGEEATREGRGGVATALLPMVLIVSLFFLWGMANNLNDVLIPQFRKAFALNDLQSGLVQSAFYMGYLLLALPASLFMQRFGYKAGVLCGLVLYGLGALLFCPAAESRLYGAFLGALFVIASGLAFLETSANPLVIALGDPKTGASRLGLAQAFNPLGSIAGIAVGRQFIFSGVEHTPAQLAAMSPAQLIAFHQAEAHAVQLPYLVIGIFVLAWAAVTAVTPFPRVAVAREAKLPGQNLAGDLARLFGRRRYLFGVVAQFFYVGAQVGVWSFLIRYAQRETGAPERTAADYLFVSLVAFTVGRFVGSFLMSKVRSEKLMAAFALINVGLCLVGVMAPGTLGLWALVGSSFFMSVMYPTIFALSVRGLGPLTKLGASLLVMSIIGGAVLTALMGWISDSSSIATAMIVPAVCFVVVGLFAWTARSGPSLGVAAETPAIAP
jgi:FHS family L-fucose permease-like MFS transporter